MPSTMTAEQCRDLIDDTKEQIEFYKTMPNLSSAKEWQIAYYKRLQSLLRMLPAIQVRERKACH